MSEEKNSISSATKEYTQILLHQYSECWQSIRNDSNAVWQIPTLLLATISVLGIAYTQASNIPIGRILMLSVGLGFSLVSLIALVKHRLSCNCKTVDFENIEKQLMRLLKQEEFESLFKKINKDARENEKVRFREIKFMGKDIADSFEFRERHIFGKWELKKECLASERRWFYRRSAYDQQLGLTVLILFGIAALLGYEFWLQDLGFLIPFEFIAFLYSWFGAFWEEWIRKREKTMDSAP